MDHLHLWIWGKNQSSHQHHQPWDIMGHHGTSWDIMGHETTPPSKPTGIFPAFLGIPNSPVSATRFAKSRRSVEWNAGSARWETFDEVEGFATPTNWAMESWLFNRNAYNDVLFIIPTSPGSILNPLYIYTLNNEGFFIAQLDVIIMMIYDELCFFHEFHGDILNGSNGSKCI